MPTLTCETCGDDFEVIASRADTARFCSRTCFHEHGRVTLTCETCGMDFEVVASREDTALYCSADCSPLHSPSERVTLACATCGDDFDVKPFRADTAKYCSRSCMYGDRSWSVPPGPNPEATPTSDPDPDAETEPVSRTGNCGFPRVPTEDGGLHCPRCDPTEAEA